MLKRIIETYQQTGFLHHAYLLVGKREIIKPVLTENLKALENDATTIWENYETFGINESRGLIERSMRRNWSGGREFVILIAERYTVEAQNALLKLFEEPRTGLHFFILGERAADFLPTLQSRLMIIESRDDDKSEKNIQAKRALEFLFGTPVDRLNFITEELKKEPPRESWLPFLNALEIACHQMKPFDERALAEIMMTRNYLADPASSPRLLFEHLAFVLPRVVK